MSRRALVLFGHGSRDSRWRQPIEAVAERIRRSAPDVAVACAYLELDEPDLPTAAAGLIDQGAAVLTVLPMFLGVGKHARHDLPALVQSVQAQHPHVQVRLLPAIGEEARVLDFLAQIAIDAA